MAPRRRTSTSNRPDFSEPQGAPKSEALEEVAFPIPEGMRPLTPEEERAAIPLPQKKNLNQMKRPSWIPEELDFSELPAEMQEYVHSDLSSAADESPLQTDALIEVMQEIERENAASQPNPPRRRSSFAPAPAPVPAQPEPEFDYEENEQATEPYAMPQQTHRQAAPVAAPVYQQPRPVPRQAPQAQRPVAPKVKHHPVFDSLLRDFGLHDEIKFDVYKGHKFSFRQYNAEQNTFCISLADSLSSSAMEYSERIRHSLVCVSLVAIDDVPVYEILGQTAADYGFALPDRFAIPSKMSMLLVEPLRALFLEKFSPNVIMDLWAIYDRLFPTAIVDQTDEEGEKWRFKCPVKGCTHSIDAVPEIGSDGNPRPHFCPQHGTELFILGPVADLEDIPLA